MATGPFKRSLSPDANGIGPKYPRLAAFRDDPQTDAVASKLVEGLMPKRYDNRGNREIVAPADFLAWKISDSTANNVSDAQNMMQLLPDLELAKQVLISSILSPNDMMSCELTFRIRNGELNELGASLLQVIRDYFEVDYKIEALLPKILEDVLFMTGSYPMAVLPESTIDDAINSPERVSMERLSQDFDRNGNPRSVGILGPAVSARARTSMESLGLESGAYDPTFAQTVTTGIAVEEHKAIFGDAMLHVTDNPNVLKHPMLRDKITQDRIQDALTVRHMAMEAKRADMLNDRQVTASLYRPRNYKNVPVMALKTLANLEKPTVGHPLVMTLPSESVIPVHVPGTPEEHIGYFIVVDRFGNPVTKAQLNDYYADLSSNININKQMSSQLLNVTKRGVQGRGEDRTLDVEEATRIYTEIIENELLTRMRNGVYGEDVKISRPQEVYRVMFARACSKMYTQLVYVPAQLMTYIAFDYNENGVGRSLLEATKVLGSIRAMLLFADTMAAIKNSVSHVALNIALDPQDPDPSRTVEFLVHEYAKTRQASYPIGASNPLDIINYLQNAGVEVAVTGHPGYPETKLSVEDKQSNKVRVDSDLSENLKKRHLMAIGIAPETVDLSMGVDFATSVVASNVLLAKRAMIHGKKLTGFVTDFIQKYTYNSAVLMDKLREKIKSNPEIVKAIDPSGKLGVDQIALYFIHNLEVALPEPDLTQIEMQETAFESYNKLLDAVIPAFLDSAMFDTSTMGNLSNGIPMTAAVLKSYMQRKWLQSNNVMPEMFELLNYTESDGAALDLMKNHEAYMESLSKSLLPFMVKASEAAKANDAKLEAAGAETPPAGGGGEGGGAEGGAEGGGTGDEFDFSAGDEEVPPPEGDEVPPAEEGGEPAAATPEKVESPTGTAAEKPAGEGEKK